MVARCLAHAPHNGAHPTAVPGLWVYRRSATSAPGPAVYGRSIFLVVQGRKQARVGEDVFVYDPDHYLVTSVPLPVTSQIVAATEARPFVSLAVDIELDAVRRMMTLAGDVLAPGSAEPPERGLVARPVTPALRQVTARLVELLDRPDDAPVLGPLYVQELLYLVLKGPRGGVLRAVAMGAGRNRSIAEVLTLIHRDCTVDVAVPELASAAGMSESVFYEAFKAVTAQTPKQYIKRLRLQEAHRQLTSGQANVSGAAHAVGYNSLSQFSREFTRLFGANPSAYLPSRAHPT